MPAKAVTKSKKYTYAVGRRKTATARVRLFQSKGENLINESPAPTVFTREFDRYHLMLPLELTSTNEKYHFSAKVAGSGVKAQRDAIAHGLARALAAIDVDNYRPVLKKAGLLTRDPRMKESRKVGTGGKARRKKQSPKR